MRALSFKSVISPRISGVARHQLIAVMLLILVATSVAKGAGEVLIVKASDAEPYQQAEAAVRDELTRRHYSIRTTSLKDVTQSSAPAAARGSPSASSRAARTSPRHSSRG